jgi:nitrate/TMAO reductase-like tetraheme cytochrome c subunit
MRRFVLIAVALLVAGVAEAKPSTVKGALCKACHAMPPKKDNLNAKSIEMMKKYKEADCKNCHGWADGKLTSKKA